MLVFAIVLIEALSAFPQATPIGALRIANATTAFGVNIPVGTIVVNLATNIQWQANAGVISTATLTTASTSFTQIGGVASTATTATNLAGGLGGSIPYQTAVNTTAMLANGTSGQALLSAGGTAAPTWGTPWTSANTTGTSGGLSGSALSGDVTNAGNAITIASGAVTLGKMANLAANSFIGNNTGSPATPIALTKSQMIAALNVNRASENFENAADSLSGTTTVHLANTPQAGTITVILNGLPLTSTQYGVDQTTHVVIFSSCYKYDKIAVAYSY